MSDQDKEEGLLQPPPLRSNLFIQDQTHRGEAVVIVQDPVTNRFFRLPKLAHIVASYFDSSLEMNELATIIRDRESTAIDPTEVEEFALHLESLGLLEQRLTNAEIDLRQRKELGSGQSILYYKLPIFNPDPLLDILSKVLRPLLSKSFLIVLSSIILFATVLSIFQGTRVALSVKEATRGSGLLWLYLSTALTLTIHEFAHAIATKHFGGRVREMGFLLLYFMPCAYTDISSAYMVPKKRDRILITLAGSFADLGIWALAAILLIFTSPSPPGMQILGALMLTTGYRSFALNLNPLIKLDGYYVLVDLLEMPNLLRRSRAIIAYRIKGLFKANPVKPQEKGSDWRTLEIYGWLSTTYIVSLLSFTLYWLIRLLPL